MLEINKTPLNVCVNQLHTHPVADIQAPEPLQQFAFNRHLEKPHPGAFRRSARDDRLKLLPDSRFQQKRGRGFADLAFDLVGSILCCGEMFRQDAQFRIAIQRGSGAKEIERQRAQRSWRQDHHAARASSRSSGLRVLVVFIT